MTVEKAIELFKDVEVLVFRDVKQKYFHEDIEEAFKLAIKALEQEPCEDAISRAEALKAIEKEKQGWEGAERYAIDECHSRIAELPSVTPQLNLDRTTLINTALDTVIKEVSNGNSSKRGSKRD